MTYHYTRPETKAEIKKREDKKSSVQKFFENYEGDEFTYKPDLAVLKRIVSEINIKLKKSLTIVKKKPRGEAVFYKIMLDDIILWSVGDDAGDRKYSKRTGKSEDMKKFLIRKIKSLK